MPFLRACPLCGGAIAPALLTSANPDYWARGSQGEGWTVSRSPPERNEEATRVAFRCPSCVKSFRMVMKHGSASGPSGSGAAPASPTLPWWISPGDDET